MSDLLDMIDYNLISIFKFVCRPSVLMLVVTIALLFSLFDYIRFVRKG